MTDKEIIEKYSFMIDLDAYERELNSFPELIWPKYELRVADYPDGMHIRIFTFVKDSNSDYYMPVAENYLNKKFSGIDSVNDALNQFEDKCELVVTYGLFNKQTAVKLEKNVKVVK